MRFVRALSTAAIFLTSASVQAQVTVKFQPTRPNPAVTAFGYYVGPFWGTVTSDPTKPVIDLYCVDVLNSVNWGQTWNANLTNLASSNFSLTRHGAAKMDAYKKAAYLASWYNNSSINHNTQWGGIQAAIWNLLNPGNPNGGTNASSNTTEAYWLAQANSWYGNAAAVAQFDFSRWTIVTDVSAAGNVSGQGVQEFLTTGVTPEPETWILLGTGLLAIVGFAVKRNMV